MKKVFIFPLAVFAFCPVFSMAESPSVSASDLCQSQLTELQERYDNSNCDGRRASGAECILMRTNLRKKKGECQEKAALEKEKRKVKDAKTAVDKQKGKSDKLSKLSQIVGTGLVVAGTIPCPKKCNWPLIATGLAGIAMGQVLKGNSNRLADTSGGLEDDVTTCVGDTCAPPPPGGGPAPPPGPGGLGTGLLGGGPTLPDFTNCEPSCPCPPGAASALENCKITKDENGAPKLTHGPDKDKDGFGDEEVTAADAAKVNQNDPKIKAAIAAAKAPYAAMFAELEEDEGEGGEELLASAEEGAAGEEGFLSGGSTSAGRSAATPSAGGSGRRKPTVDDDMKAVQGLMAQFMNKKKKKKKAGLKTESKLLGKSQIGVARDNIFLMVHRRYQERRGENEFIEPATVGGASALTQNLFK